MNKIKLLYDVVTTMKKKDGIKGTLQAEGKKDGEVAFSLDNSFERDFSSGQAKSQVSMELDHDGKKVKHESSTDCNMGHFHEHMHRHFMGHVHSHCFGPNEGGCEGRHHSLKDGLTRFAFMLKLFNEMKIEEREDKGCELSLDISELPGEMKEVFHAKFQQGENCEGHKHFAQHAAMKELFMMEKHSALLSISINKDSEVEKVVLQAEGKTNKEQGGTGEMNFRAEVQLNW